MTEELWDEALRGQRQSLHAGQTWQDEISLLITEGPQLFHLGLHHRNCKKWRRVDDRLEDLQLVGGGEIPRSWRHRVIRAWQLIMFRRFLRSLLHPLDRLEVYYPPSVPTYFHRLPAKIQRKLGWWLLDREHPLGLSRAPDEAFQIWPGVLVLSRTEIDRAIGDERLRLARKRLRAQAPRNAIGYRSKKWRPHRAPIRPRRPQREA